MMAEKYWGFLEKYATGKSIEQNAKISNAPGQPTIKVRVDEHKIKFGDLIGEYIELQLTPKRKRKDHWKMKNKRIKEILDTSFPTIVWGE